MTIPGAWPSQQQPQAHQLASGVDQLKQQLLSKIDPQLRLQASEWTEHKTPDGKVYFFHIKTQQSVWVKPEALTKLEGKVYCLVRTISNNFKNPVEALENARKEAESATASNNKENKEVSPIQQQQQAKTEEKKEEKKDQLKPVSRTAVPGTPW